ncbi:MAG: hypothetical protein ACFCBU_10220 [Cyanophyceae cyanobacterium]
MSRLEDFLYEFRLLDTAEACQVLAHLTHAIALSRAGLSAPRALEIAGEISPFPEGLFSALVLPAAIAKNVQDLRQLHHESCCAINDFEP